MASIRYILDTDTVTFQQGGRPAVIQRLSEVAPEGVATTVITLYEQLRGRLAMLNRQQDDQARQIAYQRLQETHGYFCRVPVLPFDAEAADVYRSLINQGLRIGSQDVQIAAIALAHQAVLVTSNSRHFTQVPGLIIEDWNR
ncbi:MAG: type II toxin-antitoxin system VapC family toxin [Oscillochloridaceae bacterium umkhey_bin13]